MARRTKKVSIREQIALERGTKPVKKPRKKRKPMTEEQKAAAAERLALARAKRAENTGPAKNVHPDVAALPEDHALSLKKVRQWIKTQKELLAAARASLRQNAKGAEYLVAKHEGYIRNLEKYIRDGVYVDAFSGEHQQTKVTLRCVVPAYDKDGNIKRSFGVYYDDLGYTYTGLEDQ